MDIKKEVQNLKSEFNQIVFPSLGEALYVSFIVVLMSIFVSILIISVDYFIASVINTLLF